VQDPTAVTGAAAMVTEAGFLNDPVAFPGLAHFCEHMLFLGTEKFPDEGAFQRYVTTAGGSNNAFTAADETTYFFDVQSASLPGALERFAGFFTGPLFTPTATSREVNAIDSEHSKNLQSDFWRYEQLFKLRADQSHPYAKFGTGNKETLKGGDASARDALLKFHSRYYQADRMGLALVGPQSLQELRALAVKNFAAVPVADPPLPIASAEYDSLPLPFRPADPPEATLMVPVKDTRNLKLTWCLPTEDVNEFLQTKPEDVWSLLVQNRGAGGLTPLLKKRGWANGVFAGTEEFTRSFVILSITVDLTLEGLKKWKDVASLLFSYLRMLANNGVPEYLVTEYRTMLKTGFEYAEPAAPESFATTAVSRLELYPPEQWVTGPSTLAPGTERGTQRLLEFVADPRKALITLIAKSVEPEAPLSEPIYGTKYGMLGLSNEVEAWAKAEAPPELALPAPNPFLPKDLSIRCKDCVAPAPQDVAPRVLIREPGLLVHFLPDAIFKRPKAFQFLLFRSPLLEKSAQTAATTSIFQSVLAETLQESTYQAALAGLGASVAADYSGLLLTAQGYSSRLPELVDYIAKQIKTAELAPEVFELVRERLRLGLANAKQKQPVGLASYERSLSLETPRYPVEELEAAVTAATLQDVQDFQRALFPECYLEAFVAGNVAEDDARRAVSAARAALPASGALADESIPQRKVRVLPPGRTLRQSVAPNAAEANSACEVYLQVGPDVGDDWLHLLVLSRVLSERFYTELRTNQQLGYIVQSAVTESEGVRGLVLTVQSNVVGPPEVEERMNTFLKDFRDVLATLAEEELDAYRVALATQSTDVDKRLAGQVSRFWSEIVTRRYDYSRPWTSARRLRGVTREGLLGFFDARIAPGASGHRRLATHVFAPRAAPKELVVDSLPEEFYPPREVRTDRLPAVG